MLHYYGKNYITISAHDLQLPRQKNRPPNKIVQADAKIRRDYGYVSGDRKRLR